MELEAEDENSIHVGVMKNEYKTRKHFGSRANS